VAEPAAVVTVKGPLVAPTGTTTLIDDEESKVNDTTLPFSFTPVTPVNVNPLIVTYDPAGPLVGEKLMIVGDTLK
jgi:hypothetical protein